MSIRDWPESDWRREKLLKVGATGLSEAELLAILLGAGVRGRSAGMDTPERHNPCF